MAKLSRLSDPTAVIKAIEEFDSLGRRSFLAKYGFGKAEKFFLLHKGRYYDSKAIVGVAYGRQFPGEGPLGHRAFSGGLAGAVQALRQLGFDVTELAPRMLVLAQNEISADSSHNWQDVEGERYHFPNVYRNKIVPGARFIYYRGKRRRSGHAEPEYFGCGVVGDVMKDPESTPQRSSQQRWLAEVAEYWPFPRPISFRGSNREYLETGTRSVARNYFGVGVRDIDPDRYFDIVSRGGFAALAKASAIPTPATSVRPRVTEGASLLMPARNFGRNDGIGTSGGGGRRYCGQAKQVGDRAEEVFLGWLRETEPDPERRESIVWVAAQGQLPGYDIEDRRIFPSMAYEVKGTAGPLFPSVELTANELRAASQLGDRFHLVLVSNCLESTPVIEVIRDPVSLLEQGTLSSTPVLFRIQRHVAEE